MPSEQLPGTAEETTTPNNPSSTTDQLVEQIPIQDTPFTAVRLDKKWFLAIGKYRLTEPTDKYEAVEAEVVNSTWDLLARVINVFTIEAINDHLISHHSNGEQK